MWRIFAFFALVFLLMLAFKIAIVLLVIAGLIFKTKETVGLLVLGGIINAFAYHPWIAIGLTVVLLCTGRYFKLKEMKAQDAAALPQLPAPADGKEL